MLFLFKVSTKKLPFNKPQSMVFLSIWTILRFVTTTYVRNLIPNINQKIFAIADIRRAIGLGLSF